MYCSEACPAVGYKGHMLLMNQIRGEYAPGKIKKLYFSAPDEKRLLRGADAKTSLSLDTKRNSAPL